MPQLDVFHVVEDCVQALSLVDHLVGRDENELRVPVDEFLDEPWAGDAVDLDVLARDPFHAILHFALHANAAIARSVFGPMRNRPLPRVLDGSVRRQCGAKLSYGRMCLYPLPPSAEGRVFRYMLCPSFVSPNAYVLGRT